MSHTITMDDVDQTFCARRGMFPLSFRTAAVLENLSSREEKAAGVPPLRVMMIICFISVV